MYQKISDQKSITIKYSNDIPKERVSGNEIYQVDKDYPLRRRLASSTYIELEIMRHTGGRMLYGKLGFVFEQAADEKIRLEIPYSRINTNRCDDTILPDRDHCYQGITEEYVTGIVKDIYNYMDKEKEFPCCKITLMNAANCDVGSCQAFYSIIVDIILDMFMERIDPPDNEQDKDCFIEYVKNKMK